MYFRKPLALAAAIGMSACGAPLQEPSVDTDLPSITFFTEASGSGMQISDEQVAFIDARINHLVRFKEDPFEFVDGIELQLGTNTAQWFLAASDARYFVTVNREDYAIINADGMKDVNPVPLSENIQAVALSATQDYLFLQDELGKLFVLGLDENGEYKNRYSGSATFGTDEAFVAGTMLSDGRFIASLGETMIALVDLEATLEEQEWQVETFDVADASAMTWLAAVPGTDDQVMIKDSNRLLLLDFEAETILDEVDLSGKQDVRASRLGYPHLMAADNLNNDEDATQPYQLYHAEEDELMSEVISSVKANYSTSYYDVDNTTLVVTVNELDNNADDEDEEVDSRFEGDVFRFETDNGVPIDKTELGGSTRVAITDKFVVQHFNSALGLAKRLDYGDEDNVDTLKLFNIELLRNKYD